MRKAFSFLNLWQVVVLLIATPYLALAQAPDVHWQRCWGGSVGDFATGIIATTDGGSLVSAWPWSSNGDVTCSHGDKDYWLVKLDADGATQWQQCYGGLASDRATGAILMADGGYLVYGISASNEGDVDCASFTSSSFWVLKVNEQGEMQWSTCWDAYPLGVVEGASSTQDGGAIVVGGVQGVTGMWEGNHGGTDLFAVKIDASGTVEWANCYGGTGNDVGYTAYQASDGGYILGGNTGSTNGDLTGQQPGTWMLKVDPIGELEWSRTYATGQGSYLKGIMPTQSGGYLLLGSVTSDGGNDIGYHGGTDFWAAKLDADGNLIAQRCFGGSEGDLCEAVAATTHDSYIMAGRTKSVDGDVSAIQGPTYDDLWVIEIDEDLNLLWQKCLGGTATDHAQGVACTSDGGTVIAGNTLSNDGDVSGNHGSWDVWLVKLAPYQVDVPEVERPVGLTVYPSPTDGLLNVRLPERSNGIGKLDVLDLTGRIVLHQNIDQGMETLQLSVHALATGSYCLRLTSGSEISTTKFMKH